MANNTLQRIKAQVGKVNWRELYTLLLIVFGVPGLVLLWSNWKAALTAFVLINIALGWFSLKGNQ